MRVKILEFNKLDKNGRLYTANLEEVQELVNQIESKNRCYLTSGLDYKEFNNSGEYFKAFSTIKIEDIIGKFENCEIICKMEEDIQIIEVYANLKILKKDWEEFFIPEPSFAVRALGSQEKIKHLISFDLKP